MSQTQDPSMDSMTGNSSTSSNARSFVGIVETTVEAMRLIYAAHHGIIPRISRRLNLTERKEWIISGAVFVFDVEESKIRRWTDGLDWTPSRIAGNFLMYREINEKCNGKVRFEEWIPGGGAHGKGISSGGRVQKGERSRSATPSTAADGGLKIGGLIKKTITIRINGLEYHLISYYTQEDLDAGHLQRISSQPDIMRLDLPSSVFEFSNFRHPPIVEVGEDGFSETIYDPEILDSPVNNSERLLDESKSYHPEQPDDGKEYLNPPGWVPSGAPTSPVAPIQDNSVLPSTSSRPQIESWQRQYSSMKNAQQGNPDQGYKSQAIPPSEQLSHDDILRSNEQTSQYRRQDQISPLHPHRPNYLNINSFPSASSMVPRNFQLQANEKVKVTEGSSSTTESGNGGSRHGEQSQPIWLSAASHSHPGLTFQGSNFGASYSYAHHDPAPPPTTYHLPHHPNVYRSMGEWSSSGPQYPQTTALASLSTTHNHTQSVVPGTQSYDDTELLERVYEH